MSGLRAWFGSQHMLVKMLLIVVVAIVLIRIVNALSGPLFFLSLLAAVVFLTVFFIRLSDRAPSAWWGLASGATFVVAMLLGIVWILGSPDYPAASSPAETASAPTNPEVTEETRYVTVEETVERTVTAAPAEKDSDDDSDNDKRRAAPVSTNSDENPSENDEVARDEPEEDPANTAPVEEESDDNGLSVAVASVTDGDTIEIAEPVEGLTDVRLIGMDTPETYGGTEPYGPEASAFAATLLEGQTVELELDEEVVDPYGRLLAYVYLPDGTMANEALVEGGYAQVATFPPNTRYENDFIAAQDQARAAGIGIWSLTEDQLCQLADRGNGIGGGCEELPVVQPEPAPVPGIDEEPIIEEAPRLPEPPSTGATDGWYSGAPDLDCSDFSSAVTVSPGDPFGLDADGDGTGCDS